MANITLSLSEELYARMREHSEFRWSEIARRAIMQKLEEAEIIEDLRALESAAMVAEASDEFYRLTVGGEAMAVENVATGRIVEAWTRGAAR